LEKVRDVEEGPPHARGPRASTEASMGKELRKLAEKHRYYLRGAGILRTEWKEDEATSFRTEPVWAQSQNNKRIHLTSLHQYEKDSFANIPNKKCRRKKSVIGTANYAV